MTLGYHRNGARHRARVLFAENEPRCCSGLKEQSGAFSASDFVRVGMTRYDRGMKVAISLPDDVLARIDAAAARLDVNRSEFLRTAGLRLVAEVEGESLTERIDRHLGDGSGDGSGGEGAGGDDAALDRSLAARSRASAAEATAGETW